MVTAVVLQNHFLITKSANTIEIELKRTRLAWDYILPGP